MVLLTASFIREDWYATGLTPTVTAVNTNLNTTESFTMTEINPGNYIYRFDGYIESHIYFFNYDANDDTVINRYQSTNNNEIKIVYQMGTTWGVNAAPNKEKDKEKELIRKIVEEVKKELPSIEDIDKIAWEKAGLIVQNLEKFDVQFDDGTILSSIEKNSKVIENKIDNIKIPVYDDSSLKNTIISKIDSIEKVDLQPIENKLDKIDNKIKDYKLLDETIQEHILQEKKLEELLSDRVKEETILESLLEKIWTEK